MTKTSLAVLFSVALATHAMAQGRPDFSGTWTMDEQRSGSPDIVDQFVRPVIWTIRQTDQMMVVDMKRGDKLQTLTFTMGEKLPAPKGADVASNRAYWEGDRLVTETIQNIQGQTLTTRETRQLMSGGREMLVERVVEVEHGYTFKGAQNYSIVKDIFVRQP